MGYVAISSAAVLWAVGGTVARALIDHGASAVELTEARAWIAAAGLGLFVLARRRPRDRARVGFTPAVVVFGLSIACANLTYYLALARLPVAVAIVVQYTAPGLVVVWTALSERRRPSGRVTAALVLAMGGVLLLSELRRVLVSGRATLSPTGLAIAAASAVAFATYMVTGERVGRSLDTSAAVFRGFVVAGVLWAAVQAARGRPHTLLQARFLPGVLFLALFTTIAPFALFLWGLRRVDVSRAGIVSTLEPVTAALIAWVWLGQSLTAAQIGGAVMVVVGIAVVQAERPQAAEVLAERAAID